MSTVSNWRTNHKLLFRLLLISVCCNLIVAIYFISKRYYYKRLSIIRIFDDTKTDIVVLGDSRASGGNWNKILQREDVFNCGIGGFTVEELTKKLDTAYNYKPSTCIIQIGINDIRNNADIDTTFLYYRQIIDNLLKHHLNPIVTSIIPLRTDYWSDLVDYKIVNLKTDSLNQKLKQLCKEKAIKYVDINKSLADNGRLKREYTYDGIHLNDSGYILVGQEIQPHLKN